MLTLCAASCNLKEDVLWVHLLQKRTTNLLSKALEEKHKRSSVFLDLDRKFSMTGEPSKEKKNNSGSETRKREPEWESKETTDSSN